MADFQDTLQSFLNTQSWRPIRRCSKKRVIDGIHIDEKIYDICASAFLNTSRNDYFISHLCTFRIIFYPLSLSVCYKYSAHIYDDLNAPTKYVCGTTNIIQERRLHIFILLNCDLLLN